MIPSPGKCAPQRRVVVCADESELGELARRWAAERAGELDATLVTLPGNPATPDLALQPVQPTDLLVVGLADGQGRIAEIAPELVAAAPCLTVLMRPGGAPPEAPVTVAVSGDPSDQAILAAAVTLATSGHPASGHPASGHTTGEHAKVHLLHSRPLPLRRSDSPEEEQAGYAVLESARCQVLRLDPCCTPSLELVRLSAQEAVSHRCGDHLLVVGARRSHPRLGLVTRAALNHARSPVAVVHATGARLEAMMRQPLPTRHIPGPERNRTQEAGVSS